MKQGSGRSSNAGRKVEPTPHIVSVPSVAQMGSMLGNKATDHSQILHGVSSELYKGKGYKAPMNRSMTTHKSGSQGGR